MKYALAILGIFGSMVGGFLLAMWVKGDLQPTRLRNLIRKWREK